MGSRARRDRGRRLAMAGAVGRSDGCRKEMAVMRDRRAREFLCHVFGCVLEGRLARDPEAPGLVLRGRCARCGHPAILGPSGRVVILP